MRHLVWKKKENKWLRRGGNIFSVLLVFLMGGCQLCFYRKFCSLFEAKRKVFNLIFNFNPLKYVRDLNVNRVKLAEDPSYGSKVISFNYWLPREFKACHLNYLSIPATSCNLLIFYISFYWSKIFRKVTSYEWVKWCDYYRQGSLVMFLFSEQMKNERLFLKQYAQ